MSEFKHTHYFLAQKIKLLDQKDGKFLVEYPDGSQGWHEGPIVPRTIDHMIMYGDNRQLK